MEIPARMGKRTWPLGCEELRDGTGCPMCAAGRPENDGYGLRIHRGDLADAYLQRRTQLPGWTTVVWRGRHVAEPTDLSPAEAGAYWAEVLKVAAALKYHFSPIKLNLAFLGNEVPHLHAHITLRYLDDPWPGRPLEVGNWTNAYTDEEYARHVDALRASLSEDTAAKDQP